MNTTYNDFIQSLVQNKEKRPIMTHLPSDIQYCKKFFDGYLTEEELHERQFTGRYWAIEPGDDNHYTVLCILLDNATVLLVNKDRSGKMVEGIYSRASANPVLPDCLRGMYYNDGC